MKTNTIFNPFEKIAGYEALLWGLGIMILSGFIGYTSHTHFNGVLSVHSGYASPLWRHLTEPLLSWVFISLWFLIWSLILSKSKIRTIDIFGTQAFAFIPMMPTSFSGYFKVVEEFSNKLGNVSPENLTPDMLPMKELFWVLIIALFIMVFVVWSAIWMYNGFKVSSNLKNGAVIPVYAVGILLGMFVPNYLTSLLSIIIPG